MIIYDNALNQIAVINNFEHLGFTRELRGAGSFDLEIAENKANTEFLEVGNILAVDDTTCGLIIERELIQTNNGKTLKIKGASLLTILSYRITTATITDNTENIAKTLVDDNLVSATDTDRNISILDIITTANNGSTQVFESENERLDKAIEKILAYDNYGHKIYIDTGALKYDVIVGATKDVQFSNKLYNLNEATQIESESNYKTYVFVNSFEYGSGAGLSRREVYVNDANVTTQAKADDRAKQELDGKYYKTNSIQGKIRIVGNPFTYKTDFDLGDYVKVLFDGGTYDVQITEVTEIYGEQGFELHIVFGPPRRSLGKIINDIREEK